MFASNDLVGNLSLRQVAKLAFESKIVTFSAGEVIFREGDQADGLYYVIEGVCGVFKQRGGGHVHLCTLLDSNWFGEIALIQSSYRTATVSVWSQSKLLFVGKDAYQNLCQETPEIKDNKYFNQLIRKRTANTLKTVRAPDHARLRHILFEPPASFARSLFPLPLAPSFFFTPSIQIRR